jgi:hypothetical protein
LFGFLIPVPDLSTPIINEDADRILGRIIIRYGLLTFVLLMLATAGMAFVNIPQSRFYHYHKPLDLLSILVVLIPFFIGISRLFATRLQLGRGFVAQRRWREAVAALDPFEGSGQRFLDSAGEAHYLLYLAYSGLGARAKAESARAFLLRHRRGVWTDMLKTAPPRPMQKPAQEKRPRPANRKPRRRF